MTRCACSSDGRHLCALCGQQSSPPTVPPVDVWFFLKSLKARLGFGEVYVQVSDLEDRRVNGTWHPERSVGLTFSLFLDDARATAIVATQIAAVLRASYKERKV